MSPVLQGDLALEIRGLSVDYLVPPRGLHAVVDVDLDLRRGEILGIAGESGSGKSTLVHAIARLLRPPAVVRAGTVAFHPRTAGTRPSEATRGDTAPRDTSSGGTSSGDTSSGDAAPVDLLTLPAEDLRRFRWRELAIVFQSAMNALNPVLSIGEQFDDVLRTHRPRSTRDERRARSAELLTAVGIPADRLRSYAHELSGGMRQRATIALALALDPQIVVMDEPTTAVDVVMQREILAQVADLRDEYDFGVLFVSHDLSLLLEICDTVAIMYAGRIVEIGSAQGMLTRPLHPYADGLLHSFPRLHGEIGELHGIGGSPPDLRFLPPGCAFNPRCRYAFEPCLEVVPELRTPAGATGRAVACHLHDPAPGGQEATP